MSNDANLSSIYQSLGITSNKTLEDMIEDKKEERSITSDKQLAKLLGINIDTLNRIIKGENKKVDIISFIKISHFLELNIDETVKIYIATLQPDAVVDIEETKKANFIIKNFDLDGLKSIGFINSKTDFKAIEKRVLSYFNIKSIFDYEDVVAYPLYSKSNLSSNDLMNIFWIKSAYSHLENMHNPNSFNPTDFKNLLSKIRPYSRLESNGLLTVIKALYVVGVNVIVQKYVSKTSVKGATFIVNDKPCIILTDFYGRYDLLWFTLFHEMCHILYDLEELKSLQIHLSGAPDLLLLNEDRANMFARTMLFSDDKMNYIKAHINNHFMVSRYADEHGVHPSIIYGFYIYDQPKSKQFSLYAKFNKYLINSEVATKYVKTGYLAEDPREEVKQILEKISK